MLIQTEVIFLFYQLLKFTPITSGVPFKAIHNKFGKKGIVCNKVVDCSRPDYFAERKLILNIL